MDAFRERLLTFFRSEIQLRADNEQMVSSDDLLDILDALDELRASLECTIQGMGVE